MKLAYETGGVVCHLDASPVKIGDGRNKAEAEAVYQADYAYQDEHIGHGKSAAMTKVFNAMGSVGAIQHHVEAEKYRAEAERLRDQLAQIEGQN